MGLRLLGIRLVAMLSTLVAATAILVIALAALPTDGEVEGDPPPATGDWDVHHDTNVSDEDITLDGNLTVHRGVLLTLTDVTLTVNRTAEGRRLFQVLDGATMTATGTTMDLDTFHATDRAALEFDHCDVWARGTFHAEANSFFATQTTFRVTGADGAGGMAGGDALMVADGSVSSGLDSVTIECRGGAAGAAPNGTDGLQGGDATVICNASSWLDCTVLCVAGNASRGGESNETLDAGDGALGGHARVWLAAVLVEDSAFTCLGGTGSHGSNGRPGHYTTAGDGGVGGVGGDADLRVRSLAGLTLEDSVVRVTAGRAGSGGSGGVGVDQDAGNGGDGGRGGDSVLELTAEGAMDVKGCELVSTGGEGGYGGGFGIRESGSGEWGLPGRGGIGGEATAVLRSEGPMALEVVNVLASSGDGAEGGAGYNQGEPGGGGGAAQVELASNISIDGELLDVIAQGGHGGDGGEAVSQIRGNGGDGGGTQLLIYAAEAIEVWNFSIVNRPGMGGSGNKAPQDGTMGIPTLDLETLMLVMGEGVLSDPLDDLSGDARGYLYNVTFTGDCIPVLPISDAEAWAYFPVWVRVTMLDEPAVGWDVYVTSTRFAMRVAEGATDDGGEWYAGYLEAFHYTSTEIEYLGDYDFWTINSNGSVSRHAHGDVQGPTYILIEITKDVENVQVLISEPGHDESYIFEAGRNETLIVRGQIHYLDAGGSNVVSVNLFLIDDAENATELVLAFVPADAYGSGDHYQQTDIEHVFNFSCAFRICGGDVVHSSGDHAVRVEARNLVTDREDSRSVSFEMLVDPVWPRDPSVTVNTLVHGQVWNTSMLVVVMGEASDDTDVRRVEYRLDGGNWSVAEGTEEWSFEIDVSELHEGDHRLEVRAFDGYNWSTPWSAPFSVVEVSGDGSDPDERTGSGTWVALAVIVVVVVALLLALLLRRRSSGGPQDEFEPVEDDVEADLP